MYNSRAVTEKLCLYLIKANKWQCYMYCQLDYVALVVTGAQKYSDFDCSYYIIYFMWARALKQVNIIRLECAVCVLVNHE
jgi:hypothetical protein